MTNAAAPVKESFRPFSNTKPFQSDETNQIDVDCRSSGRRECYLPLSSRFAFLIILLLLFILGT